MKEDKGRQYFENILRFKMSPENIRLVMKAYRRSKYSHKNQKRKGGERYFEHPKAVALIIIEEFKIYDHELIIAALFHDGIEDTFIFGEGEEAFKELEEEFGERIRELVQLVTKTSCSKENKEQRDLDYYTKILTAPIEVKILKIADRIHNLRTLEYFDQQKREEYLKESMKYIYCIAESLISQRLDIFMAFVNAYQEARDEHLNLQKAD